MLTAAVALIPPTEAIESLRTVILLPGLLIAAIFWPEGAHSGKGVSGSAVWLLFGVMYLVTFIFWGLVVYGVVSAISRTFRVHDST